jgi:hypothetical protein
MLPANDALSACNRPQVRLNFLDILGMDAGARTFYFSSGDGSFQRSIAASLIILTRFASSAAISAEVR